MTLAKDLAHEADLLRRRFVHATRPRGPLTLEQAMDLCQRLEPMQCKACGSAISTGELCVDCARENDPFVTADNCGGDLKR